MIAAPPNINKPITVLELKSAPPPLPGDTTFEMLLRAYLPAVHGIGARLLSERPDLVEPLCLAVFQAFLSRYKTLPRNTVIASWLLRALWFGAVRQRKEAGLAALPDKRSADVVPGLIKRLLRLPVRRRDAVVLFHLLSEPRLRCCQALRVREGRFKKEEARGMAQLAKDLRKRKATSMPEAIFQELSVVVPAEVESNIRVRLQTESELMPKPSLARHILESWRWFKIKRVVRRMVAATATVIFVLAAFVATMIWLSQKGFFNAWSIQNSGRQLVKQFPGLGVPARPWPTSELDRALVTSQAPRSAKELYTLSNIWVSKLSFTAAEWKNIQPSRIEPVQNMMKNGRIELRNPKAKRNGLAGVVGIDFNWAEGRLEFADQPLEKVGVRYRGNGTYLNSLFGPKQSFKVDLNRQVPPQTLAGVRALNYVNAIPDNSYLHDALGQELFRALGVVAPRTSYSYLTLDVPGKFTNQALGLYVLIENIDADFALDRLGSKKAAIFKPVTYDLFKDLGKDWKAYEATYDLKTKAPATQLERVMEFSSFVTSASDEEFARRLPEFLEIEEYAGFVAGHVLLSSYDGYLANGQNYYMYLNPKSNRFGFISWDQDHAWGEFGYVGKAAKREHANIWHPAVYPNHFLERVMRVDTFQKAYRAKLEWALANYFSVERLYPRIDSLAAKLRPAIGAESQFRLGRFDSAISTNWLPGPRDGAPEGPAAPVHQLKLFITNRTKSIRDQLDGKVKESWPGVTEARIN
ncbi:MAG: Inner spore coat protein [Verrucomicrobiales bacterium]|nr:Inner spore coat protein [Verrucomicrobiales bacterium]